MKFDFYSKNLKNRLKSPSARDISMCRKLSLSTYIKNILFYNF